MNVLLCGEGVHDVGRVEWCPRTKREVHKDGWMQGFVRNLAESAVTMHASTYREVPLLPRDQSKHRPLPTGRGAKALAAKIRAQLNGWPIVVFMADADTNARKDWLDVHREVEDGLSLIPEVGGVACIPMSTSESWLLADPRAWEIQGLAHANALPAKPEQIWGTRNDPNGNHPKHYFARVCRTARVEDDRETRSRLAADSDIAEMEARCPTSFRPFADELRAAFAP